MIGNRVTNPAEVPSYTRIGTTLQEVISNETEQQASGGKARSRKNFSKCKILVHLLEFANGGTAFIDEIGDVSISLQARLWRCWKPGTFDQLVEAHQQFSLLGSDMVSEDQQVPCIQPSNISKLQNLHGEAVIDSRPQRQRSSYLDCS